jgi:hypothetical protein
VVSHPEFLHVPTDRNWMTARRSSGAGAADGICRFAYLGYLNLVRTALAPSAVGAPDQLTNLDQVPVG